MYEQVSFVYPARHILRKGYYIGFDVLHFPSFAVTAAGGISYSKDCDV